MTWRFASRLYFSRKWSTRSGNILTAFSQRRQMNGNDVQPIEKIVAKSSGPDFRAQVPSGRGHDADIDGHGSAGSHRLELPFLQYAQKLYLQARAHFADFIQEKRAAVGRPEASFIIAHGAGECAFDMAEQFGFEQRFRKRSAIHFDQRAGGAVAVVVHDIGDQFLAGAGFSRDQNGRTGTGGRGRQTQQAPDRGAAADDAVDAIGPPQFFAPAGQPVEIPDAAWIRRPAPRRPRRDPAAAARRWPRSCRRLCAP